MLFKFRGKHSIRALAVLALSMSLIDSASTTGAPAKDASEFLVVDCLLPGQVRKLGTMSTYVTARQAIRTSAVDCEIRGGEYVAYDRADYRTALKVWLPKAQAGDAESMTNVGEIYEKGLGLSPDYEVAAFWYNKAAELNFTRAQINLGYLHEMGMGVERDPRKALDWYRKASGVDTFIDLSTSSVPASGAAQQDPELVAKLEGELVQLRDESTRLRTELDKAHAVLAKTSKQKATPAPKVTPPPPRVIVKVDPRTAQELSDAQASLIQRENEVAELDSLLSQTRQQLAATQRNLKQSQQIALQQPEVNADGKQAEIEQLAQELSKKEAALKTAQTQDSLEREKQAAELKQRETQLLALETELMERRDQLTSSTARIEELQAQVAALEAEKAKQGVNKTTELALAKNLMVGPELTLIDPILPQARGDEELVMRSIAPKRQIIGRITAPAGLLSLTINEVATNINPQGVFSGKVTMSGSINPVSIVAVDNQGKRSAVNFKFEYETATAATTTNSRDKEITKAFFPDYHTIKFGKYYALVIGNNDYQSLTDLKTAVNDAEDLASVLSRSYGFDTTLLINADRYQILSAMNEMRTKLTSDDNLIIYYAGHGVLDEVNMRGHWLPIDAEAGNTANWISNVAITDMLNVIAAKQILVISDSCYSGSLTRSATPRLETGKTQLERLNWLRTMSTKRARMVMSSGGLEPVLDAGGGDHSVFSKALLEVLEENKDVLEGQRLYNEVAARVAYSAAQIGFDQIPEYAPIRFAGHESGEFFLVPGELLQGSSL